MKRCGYTVSTLHKNAGKSLSMIVRFMRNRAAKLGEGDHVLVDGTLKTNTSTSHSLRRIMKNLKRAKKAKVSDERWQLVKVNPSVEKMLASRGLDTSVDACIGKI